MNWFEVYHSTKRGTWDVYKVTGSGQTCTLYKVFKTENSARNFARKHWVKRWTEG